MGNKLNGNDYGINILKFYNIFKVICVLCWLFKNKLMEYLQVIDNQ